MEKINVSDTNISLPELLNRIEGWGQAWLVGLLSREWVRPALLSLFGGWVGTLADIPGKVSIWCQIDTKQEIITKLRSW